MSDHPWVKVGWSVRVKAKPGEQVASDRLELVGQVSQVDDQEGKWFRIGSVDKSYLVQYSKVGSIQILDSTTEIDIERIDPA